jgi:hypothetical protein
MWFALGREPLIAIVRPQAHEIPIGGEFMNIADEIQRLEELHRKGALSAEEFAQAKAAVLAGKSVDQRGSSGAKCYKCGSAPNRVCALCGHMFCGQHGGERWVWLSEDGSKYGARNNLTKRVICDACTPNPTFMKVSVTLAVIFFIVVLVIILSAFASFPRF